MNLESHTREILMFLENLALAEMKDMSTKEERILVDGSQWSPAERAIPGVEKVYRSDSVADEDLFWAINNWVVGWMDNGFYLGWEEGILRIYGPDYVA